MSFCYRQADRVTQPILENTCVGPKTEGSNSPDMYYCPLVQFSIGKTDSTTSLPTAIPAGKLNRPTIYSNIYTHSQTGVPN